jgi:hypothetical protein
VSPICNSIQPGFAEPGFGKNPGPFGKWKTGVHNQISPFCLVGLAIVHGVTATRQKDPPS